MTGRLREELQRLGEVAPVVEVPADTWSRGRRARRRDQALTLAAVAAVLAVVGGLVAWLPQRDQPPVADTDSLGVPERLYSVPERMSDRRLDDTWSSGEVTDDLAVGVAAAAWVTEAGLPVVVDAAEGDYHLLDLPDFGGNNSHVADGFTPPTVALAPDGRSLAYSYASLDPEGDEAFETRDAAAAEPIPSGLRVLDLVTGDLRTVEIAGFDGTAVSQIAWSPGSTWLAWVGAHQGTWTPDGSGAEFPTGGRVAPGATTSQPLRLGDHESATLAVDDTGEVWAVDEGRLVRWTGGEPRGVAVRGDIWPRHAVLTSGGLAVGTRDELEVGLIDARGRVSRIQANGDLPVGGGSAEVLGTLGDDLVVRTRSADDTDGQLLLLSTDGAAEVVGSVEPGVPDTLSLATGLMTAERPSVERPAPDWPWSYERWVLVLAGLAFAVATVASFVTWLRRRLKGAST
ncbi:hypothetical protein [Nocardioides ferulae]|uniref:hypothetical protein n=1 Tax=Nocardioides ferulae TaxID=2340821 RepID=UPI000EAD800B|nr:hypothetical protein [Nocardioides ferulae]